MQLRLFPILTAALTLVSATSWTAEPRPPVATPSAAAATPIASPALSPPPVPTLPGIQDQSFVGTIHASDGTLFYLVSGRPCAGRECAMLLYSFRSPTDKPVTFVFPGKIIDSKSHSVVYQGRAFYGQCMPSLRDREFYVVFQQERVGGRRNRNEPSVFIAEPAVPYWNEKLLASRSRSLPRLTETLRMVKSKRCHEIEGKSRQSIHRPFQAKPDRLEVPDDADDEEETPG